MQNFNTIQRIRDWCERLDVPFAVLCVDRRAPVDWELASSYPDPALVENTDPQVERILQRIGFVNVVRVMAFYAARSPTSLGFRQVTSLTSEDKEDKEGKGDKEDKYVAKQFDFGLWNNPAICSAEISRDNAWLHDLLVRGTQTPVSIVPEEFSAEENGLASESTPDANQLFIFSESVSNNSLFADQLRNMIGTTPLFLRTQFVSLGLMIPGLCYVEREAHGNSAKETRVGTDGENYEVWGCPLVEIPGLRWQWLAHGSHLGRAIRSCLEFEQQLRAAGDMGLDWPDPALPEHPRNWRVRSLDDDVPPHFLEPGVDTYPIRSYPESEREKLLAIERWLFWTKAARAVRGRRSLTSCEDASPQVWSNQSIRAACGRRGVTGGRSDKNLRDRARCYGDWLKPEIDKLQSV